MPRCGVRPSVDPVARHEGGRAGHRGTLAGRARLPRVHKEAGVKLVTNVYGTTPTGGVEMHVLQASRELARRGHEVDLLYVEPGSFEPEYRQFCRSVTKVPAVDYWYPLGRRDRPRAMLQMVPAVWAAARRRPDVIYGNRVFSNGWAVPAGRLAGAPVVCHLHGHTDLSPDADGVPQPARGPLRDHLPVRRRPMAGRRARPGQGRRGLQRHRSGRVPRRRDGGAHRGAAHPRSPRRRLRRHLLRPGRPGEGGARAARGLAPTRPRPGPGRPPGGGLVDGGS